MTRTLAVYFFETYVGDLVQDDSGQMLFTYSKSWLSDSGATPLSRSLPLREETFSRNECRGFFSGLLPDENKRELISKILGVSARNDFALLEQIGGECAGAVTFVPHGEKFHQGLGQYRKLSPAQLAEVLRTLPQRPLMVGDAGVRLSLAGAQDKLALTIKDGQFFLPLNNAPSSHIIKPANKDYQGIADNEAFCLQLAASVGIPAAKASVHDLEGIHYLLVERYDRVQENKGELQRVHQEDFCQALGLVAEKKYQKEGGPSLKQCFDLLREMSSAPVLDLKKLLDAVMFNFLVGNCDAHGKNFSLLYHDEEIQLAPLYDIVCTVYYPELSSQLAMRIGGEYELKKISLRHFEVFAKEIGFAVPMVCEHLAEFSKELLATIAENKIKNITTKKVAQIIHDRCEKVQSIF